MKTPRIAVIISIFAITLNACAGSSPTGHPDLEGTSWVLTALNKNRPIGGTQPTIQFENGQVSGNAGCNHFGGSYQIKGDTISFSALEMTEMACMEPEGGMEQELTYLELLGAAQRYELVDGILTIFADLEQTMTFQARSTTVAVTPTLEQPHSVPPTPTAEVLEPTPTPTFEPPAGFKEYQDSMVGVSVYIPESWLVTGIVEGQYAILQSYPEEKYVGGEILESGDTKCDLTIRPPDIDVTNHIQQLKSSSTVTIVSEAEIVLQSGQPGTRLEIDSMGRSISLVTKINSRTVVLTCFGDFALFDEIAVTLKGSE